MVGFILIFFNDYTEGGVYGLAALSVKNELFLSLSRLCTSNSILIDCSVLLFPDLCLLFYSKFPFSHGAYYSRKFESLLFQKVFLLFCLKIN